MLCIHSLSDTSKMEKIDELKSAGTVGSILVNDVQRAVATAYIDFPVTEITSPAAADIHKYIASTRYVVLHRRSPMLTLSSKSKSHHLLSLPS